MAYILFHCLMDIDYKLFVPEDHILPYLEDGELIADFCEKFRTPTPDNKLPKRFRTFIKDMEKDSNVFKVKMFCEYGNRIPGFPNGVKTITDYVAVTTDF